MSISEDNRIGDVLKYELDKNYCREVVTIASGQNLKVGAILGLSSGKYTATITTASEVTSEDVTITDGTMTITGGTVSTTTEDEVTTTTITGGTIAVTGGTLAESSNAIPASAILLEDCDATSADKKALVLVRAGIVAEAGLVYPASATADDKAKYKKDLEKCGIIIRKSA